jgi:formylglycine-generating enzyme required for sulfatase activity
MTAVEDRSVLLVTSTEDTVTGFATSFFVGRDAHHRAFVVTCAHVVRDLGGPESIRVGRHPARLVVMGSPAGADDVAVLEAEVPGDVVPLRLGLLGSTQPRECSVTGYRKLAGGTRIAREVRGRLDRAVLSIKGEHVGAWTLELDEPVAEGYSGSPVVDKVSGEVVGIASFGYSNQPRAVAVQATEVLRLWPEAAALVRPRLTVRGVEFVLVPAGGFQMGTPTRRAQELVEQRDRAEFASEAPRTKVALDAFYIARYPTTQEQYQAYVDDTAAPVPDRRQDPWSSHYSWDPVTRRFPDGLARHPLVLVSWTQASSYCDWLGARLPTEAEWEKAARGQDARAWPWGDSWRPDLCNTAETGVGGTTPVDTHGAEAESPHGVADLAGNVWEWCSSLFDPYPYDAQDGREDRGAEGRRVLRGGAFEQDRYLARCATRNAAPQDNRGFTIGLRAVLTARGDTAGASPG